MAFRTLLIDGQTWQFVIGKVNVEIRAPDGFKGKFHPLRADFAEAKAKDMSDEQIELGQHNDLGPADITAYIRQNCLDKIEPRK